MNENQNSHSWISVHASFSTGQAKTAIFSYAGYKKFILFLYCDFITLNI